MPDAPHDRAQAIEEALNGLGYCADQVLHHYFDGNWRELGGDELIRHAMLNLRKANAAAADALALPAVLWADP